LSSAGASASVSYTFTQTAGPQIWAGSGSGAFTMALTTGAGSLTLGGFTSNSGVGMLTFVLAVIRVPGLAGFATSQW
jgi:hypothetical protein